MTRYYYRPWKDESLVSALHFLRCRIVREGEPGLDHVDALLRQLGVDPDTLPAPSKVSRSYKRGEARRAILEALRGGPLTGRQIADTLDGYGCPERAYKYTYQALNRMKRAGMVESGCGPDGCLWRLAP